MPLTKQQISKLGKGDYVVKTEKGHDFIKDVTHRPINNLKADGGAGLLEVMEAYILIQRKEYFMNAYTRKVIVEKVDLLKVLTRNKAYYFKEVFPYDPAGEILKLLRQ